MPPRRPSSIEFEGFTAMLSLAGVRLINQSKVTGGGAGSSNSYAVTDQRTRRVIVYVDHPTNIIRFNMFEASATVNNIPIKNQTYFVVDAEVGNILRFYDTTGATPVHFVEIL